MCLCVCPQVAYKSNTKQQVYSDGSLLARTDIQHAKEVSKLASQVTHYTPQHALGLPQATDLLLSPTGEV